MSSRLAQLRCGGASPAAASTTPMPWPTGWEWTMPPSGAGLLGPSCSPTSPAGPAPDERAAAAPRIQIFVLELARFSLAGGRMGSTKFEGAQL